MPQEQEGRKVSNTSCLISAHTDQFHSIDESPETAATRKQCLTIAKYVPRGLDAFCDLDEAFQVTLLANRVTENPDDEALLSAAQKILGKM